MKQATTPLFGNRNHFYTTEKLTDREKHILATIIHYPHRNLFDVYKNPSTSKIREYWNIKEQLIKLECDDISIASANAHTFTMYGFSHKRKVVFYITPSTSYTIDVTKTL